MDNGQKIKSIWGEKWKTLSQKYTRIKSQSLLLVYTEAFRHFNQNKYPDIFFLTVAKHKKYGGQNILNIYELDVIPYQLKQGFTYSCKSNVKRFPYITVHYTSLII